MVAVICASEMEAVKRRVSLRSACTASAVIGRMLCQAEDGIRDLVRSRGLGDVYKRQARPPGRPGLGAVPLGLGRCRARGGGRHRQRGSQRWLLYTSDAADERSSVDLGGRRIINKKHI